MAAARHGLRDEALAAAAPRRSTVGSPRCCSSSGGQGRQERLRLVHRGDGAASAGGTEPGGRLACFPNSRRPCRGQGDRGGSIAPRLPRDGGGSAKRHAYPKSRGIARPDRQSDPGRELLLPRRRRGSAVISPFWGCHGRPLRHCRGCAGHVPDIEAVRARRGLAGGLPGRRNAGAAGRGHKTRQGTDGGLSRHCCRKRRGDGAAVALCRVPRTLTLQLRSHVSRHDADFRPESCTESSGWVTDSAFVCAFCN
mmetsp:Transcript_9873/g.22979  ORF Transcript_9873/g.22979 Transcript_9873/m.22979 type:complete len:253 (+) Transcript_9873:40-798(+)